MSEIKKGDRPIAAQLERSGIGLMIKVRTHPVIEDFMRGCYGGLEPSTQDVSDFARQWEPARGESRKDLLVYAIPKELTGVFRLNESTGYRLDRPGYPIFIPDDGGGGDSLGRPPRSAPHSGRVFSTSSAAPSQVLNMSFLRLVGSSSEDGVTFHIAGVYSDDTIDSIERALQLAVREIYRQFMKPIRIEVIAEERGDLRDDQVVVQVGGDVDAADDHPIQGAA